MKEVDALLLLGGNVGDRAKALRRATSAIGRWEGVRIVCLSQIFETAPVGPSTRRYFNQAVRLRTTRTPMGLLLAAKILEAAAGRRVKSRWTSRPLDVDLVAYGMVRLSTPWLTLPHPRMAQRLFALAPLAEVAPSWKLDGRRSIRSLLRARLGSA